MVAAGADRRQAEMDAKVFVAMAARAGMRGWTKDGMAKLRELSFRNEKGEDIPFIEDIGKDLADMQPKETSAPATKPRAKGDIADLPDGALIAAAESPVGDIDINRFSPEEQRILREAGLVHTVTTSCVWRRTWHIVWKKLKSVPIKKS